jgi:predicted nucleic acid-binding protein
LYVLDTNVYIDALRDRAEMEFLKQFLRRAGSRVLLAGVVAMELRAGARTEPQQGALDALIGAYSRNERVLPTSFDAHWQAGRALADVARRERSATLPPSLLADAQLACACREVQAVLVTRNGGDFARIQRGLRGFRFVEPWPLV